MNQQIPRRTLRVGVVGCGMISRNHLEAFAALDAVQVVGVCDVDPGRARATAAAWGVGNAVGSVSALLDLELDIISVCTPHPTHEAVVLEAAGAGVHVLCEKPIAIDLASAERMVAACDAAGVKLGVLFQRRFWPAAQRVRATIDDGTLGTPVIGHASVLLHRDPDYYAKDAWRGTWDTDGGGVLMTQAIHYIDLLQWYMGDIAEVYGTINTFKHGGHIEVEDSASAVLKFASGGIATLSASTAATPSLGVQIRITGTTGATAELSEFPEGTDGRVTIMATGETVRATPAHPEDTEANVDLSSINARLIPHHTSQIRDFVQALARGTDPAVTGRDANNALRILLAVYESARTGVPVRFAPFPPGVPEAPGNVVARAAAPAANHPRS
ncbi:Gfo/Idh/MocA family oxidoreductase [Arthrobacter sp. I2-34]|uniref:Gfo/Idh/MocA family oxidoreductase n=1 Tax=Arthrobacter hankyongi TaxID=2904801 RepID=A0ABS9LCP6_9MICC|nr:Gfo/Idh/MocA family oxidoreductase [Arthrobacter hankyongi]MCG2624443.1 Gfo/Idh/MocA family oxidoreductase [Arthrobacter hankyongi]